ncbi:MAG: pilus assembly protein PilM [Planctomycetota bacterium]|nr:pilus assembly protein PilM [Planctomycetota bacterium]
MPYSRIPRFRLFQSKIGWIGIDVGSAVIKAVQLERTAGGVRIAGSAIIPQNAKSLIGDGGDAVGQALRSALVRNSSFRGRDAAFALPMSVTELRSFNLPSADDDELRSMLMQELEGHSEEPTEFDYWRTESSTRTSNAASQVSVLSVDSEPATRAATQLASAGLRCQVLDGLHFAIARAVQLAAPDDDAPIAAVDWGSSTGTFILVRNGRPIFTRLLRDCSFTRLVGLGQRQLKTSAEQFESMLRQHGCRHLLQLTSDENGKPTLTTNNEQVAVGQQLMQPLRMLVDELGRTLSYLRMQMSDRFPKRMMLFGAGATIAELAPFLAGQLNFPCDAWSLPRRRADAGQPDALFGAAAALSALAWE